MKRFAIACLVVLLAGCNGGVFEGDTGPQGPQGIQGDKGDPGTNGTSFLAGDGAPDNTVGNIGDLYIDRTNGNFYGPKTAEGWGVPVTNLFVGPTGPPGPPGDNGAVGPPGPPGDDGAVGPPGPTYGAYVFTGKGSPVGIVIVGSRVGDLYIDLNCGLVYILKGLPSNWVKIRYRD